jgi:ankyrin repeat protein
MVFLGSMSAQQPPSVIDAISRAHAVGHEPDGIAAVRETLAAGGDVNERDKTGWTPLMYAALECRAEIVKLLLERGADVTLHATNERKTSFMDHGQTALTIAASCFIARRRAALAPERGMPPSYARMEFEAPRKIVRTLIRRGANVNATDGDGRTPLMMAAMHGWLGVIRELLAAKAANVRDLAGFSVLDYVDPGDSSIIRVLRKAGSPPAAGRSGRSVCDAERALNIPIIDCIWGQELSAAITKFQNEHQLLPTGELDSATRKALNIR